MPENIRKIESADRVEIFNNLKYQLAAFIAENGPSLQMPERRRPEHVKTGPETATPEVYFKVDKDITVSEFKQYPWGHPNTGAKMGLPHIPLQKNGGSAYALDKDSFPLNSFEISALENGKITISTGGNHGQFNFHRVHKDEIIENRRFADGEGYIRLDGGRLAILNPIQAEELENELLDGAMNMLRDMMKSDVDNLPPAFRQVIDNVRARIASVQNGPREGLPVQRGWNHIGGY